MLLDVVTFGELLIDFTNSGKNENGIRIFEQNPGGAPANVACAVARLGLSSAFLGKVGSDMHGQYLQQVLVQNGVDTRGLVQSDAVFTTLAFVELSDNGERKFSFSRKPGADTCFAPDELCKPLLENCKIFHFGSLSLTDEPVKSTVLQAVQCAKSAGAIIAYDPNYRASLWQDEQTAIAAMRSVLSMVDVIKISDEETALLTGTADYVQAAAYLLAQGIGCVVVTLGSKGAYIATQTASAVAGVPAVCVVDTTGAGDAFWGGFLYQLATNSQPIGMRTTAQLTQDITFANAVAALCVQKRGGIPALPNRKEVDTFLATHHNAKR